MNGCRNFEEMIDRMADPAFGEEESEALLAHVDECASCSALFDLVTRLRSDDLTPDPTDGELAGMRREVMRAVAREKSVTAFSHASRFLQGLRARPALAWAAALVVLVGGIAIGRVTAPRNGAGKVLAEESVASRSERVLAGEIQLAAERSRKLTDVENSPFTYSNVQVRKGAADRVEISFDVSRHLELDLRRDDPLLTEVLVSSLLQPSEVATRLRAISYASDLVDPRVRDGLIRAMQNDPELIVRMEAEARLTSIRDDDSVKQAFVDVLEHEHSVQMRLVAIDYLTRRSVDPAILEKAIDAGPADRTALFVRARDYLTENPRR